MSNKECVVVKITAGLGNQLFQYATARALSLYLNAKLKFDLSFYRKNEFEGLYRLDRFNIDNEEASDEEIFNLKENGKPPYIIRGLYKIGVKMPILENQTYINDKSIRKLFRENNFTGKSYYLEGWFAREKYFLKYRNTILKDINADDCLDSENKSMKYKIDKTNSIAVHIRRGEYVSHPYFTTLPLMYYKKAIDIVKKEINNPVFYFFSDDVDWIKKNFVDIEEAVFVEQNSKRESFYTTVGDVADLLLMQACKHQIIANSTFSWWGAWLNQNEEKKIYCPGKWFDNKKAQKRYERNDFIPGNWRKLDF